MPTVRDRNGSAELCRPRRSWADDFFNSDPAPLSGGTLDRVAYALDGEALTEVGIPGPGRPSLKKISELVDVAGPVTHALADRPPACGIRMTRMLRANAAHAVEACGIAAIPELKFV